MGKYIPRVHPDATYEANYTTRKQIAGESAREHAAAIAACGPGAAAYGRHIIHDKLGLEATRIIYCRQDDGVWSPPPPACDERIFAQAVDVSTASGVRYTCHAVTIPEGRFAEHAVTHLPRRYDVATVPIDNSYRPRTPEQMKAAAEVRRDRALAQIAAEEAARDAARRAAPQLELHLGELEHRDDAVIETGILVEKPDLEIGSAKHRATMTPLCSSGSPSEGEAG